METKKVERIEGTRYVKIGDSIFNTQAQPEAHLKTICECLFCGERFGGDANGKCSVYCKNCKTIEGRRKITEENKKIREENGHQ
jgi:hypothetical protein